jgi:hypothetical protein
MNEPRFSIVVPSFNQGAYIGEALESIATQAGADLEVVVMDGGSKDQTTSVLRRYENRLPLRWVSEPDSGLYEALNKAIEAARGEWIGWLNTDDLYPEGTLDRVRQWADDDSIDIVTGDAEIFAAGADGDRVTVRRCQHYRTRYFEATNNNLAISHLNACFLRRRLLRAVGTFDTRYRICADRDYLLRLMRHAPRAQHIGAVSCLYRAHSSSLTMSGLAGGTSEGLSRDSPAWSELCDICSDHLARNETPAAAQKWCRDTLREITARRFAAQLLDANLNGLRTVTASGFSTGPRWLISVGRSLIAAIAKRTFHRLAP